MNETDIVFERFAHYGVAGMNVRITSRTPSLVPSPPPPPPCSACASSTSPADMTAHVDPGHLPPFIMLDYSTADLSGSARS